MSTADVKTTTDLDATFERAMKLSPAQRLELSERLLLSVPAFGSPEIEAAWGKEIERRVREHEADPSSAIPLEDVMEEARRVADETAHGTAASEKGTA